MATMGSAALLYTVLLLHATAQNLHSNHSLSSLHSNHLTKRQSPVNCIQMCTDPTGITLENPCGKCTYSNCKFEGCVIYGLTDLHWKPDECTTCHCEEGKKTCIRDSCMELECFGYPKRKRPGQCCEECDFGIREDQCNLVPVEWKEVHLRWDPKQTCNRILVHGCDKDYAWRFRKWYTCEIVSALVNINLQTGCEHLDFQYYDAVECSERRVQERQYTPRHHSKEQCIPLRERP